MNFWQNHFLWLDVVIAASFAAAATSAVGVHSLLRRVVFLPAALSQLAGLGVVTAFLVAHALHFGHGSWLESPRLLAVIFAAGGAILLGGVRERAGATREWYLGSVFVASSALILLIGGHLPQEIHDINDVLFGNAITIEREQMIWTSTISLFILALHHVLARPFVAIAFDAQTAAAQGVPLRLLDSILFVSMGLAIATSTRVVGALPAFAFAVFPSAAALRLACDSRLVVLLASLGGALAAFAGYWASFVFSQPTGACMAAAAASLFALCWVVSRVINRR